MHIIYLTICRSEVVLASFISTLYKPELFGKREVPLRKFPHQSRLYVSLCCIFLIDD